jgi:chromosome segregation ATPase|tara:strand:- start:43 stop:240 length:198 start_codon:yes stop_codon:yes gene_type:complete
MSNMSTLNDTLEEELRRLLVEKNNECQSLRNHIKLLEKNIKDEQDMKYRAYVKIQDLQDEIKKLS